MNKDTEMLEEDDYKSRSQKKRESTALQKAGETLCSLSKAQRQNLGLPMELAEAVDAYATLKTHEARRRHMQFIGRLMREASEIERILQDIEDIKNNKTRTSKLFHLLEKTRELLLQEDELGRETAIKETLELFPLLKEPQLRHFITATLAERAKKRPPKAFRELFRYLQSASEKLSNPD